MARGIPGYTGSAVVVTTGGSYTGGGIGGYSGGTPFTLCLTERSYEIMRRWVETTCSQFEEGVSGPVGARIEFDAFYRDNGDPPATMTNEIVAITMLIGVRTLAAVCFVESFRGTGSMTAGSKYHFRGRSDGAFTFS